MYIEIQTHFVCATNNTFVHFTLLQKKENILSICMYNPFIIPQNAWFYLVIKYVKCCFPCRKNGFDGMFDQ